MAIRNNTFVYTHPYDMNVHIINNTFFGCGTINQYYTDSIWHDDRFELYFCVIFYK